MYKNLLKLILSASLCGVACLPALSNSTDFQISANVDEILTVELERVSNSAVVSSDDLDPTVNLAANEILNFGNVNALGLSPTTNSAIGANGTTGTVESRIYNSTGNIDTITEAKTSTYEGAVYFLQNQLQIRTIRTGIDLTTDVDVDNTGVMRAVVANQATYDWSTSNSITPNIINNDGVYNSVTTNLANSTPFPLDIGILIPSTMTSGNKQTILTFTGS